VNRGKERAEGSDNMKKAVEWISFWVGPKGEGRESESRKNGDTLEVTCFKPEKKNRQKEEDKKTCLFCRSAADSP